MKVRTSLITLILAIIVVFGGSSKTSTASAFGCNAFCASNACRGLWSGIAT